VSRNRQLGPQENIFRYPGKNPKSCINYIRGTGKPRREKKEKRVNLSHLASSAGPPYSAGQARSSRHYPEPKAPQQQSQETLHLQPTTQALGVQVFPGPPNTGRNHDEHQHR
jgi:hypothetical protein